MYDFFFFAGKCFIFCKFTNLQCSPPTFSTSRLYELVAMTRVNISHRNNCLSVLFADCESKVTYSYGHPQPHPVGSSGQWRLWLKFMRVRVESISGYAHKTNRTRTGGKKSFKQFHATSIQNPFYKKWATVKEKQH